MQIKTLINIRRAHRKHVLSNLSNATSQIALCFTCKLGWKAAYTEVHLCSNNLQEFVSDKIRNEVYSYYFIIFIDLFKLCVGNTDGNSKGDIDRCQSINMSCTHFFLMKWFLWPNTKNRKSAFVIGLFWSFHLY